MSLLLSDNPAKGPKSHTKKNLLEDDGLAHPHNAHPWPNWSQTPPLRQTLQSTAEQTNNWY